MNAAKACIHIHLEERVFPKGATSPIKRWSEEERRWCEKNGVNVEQMCEQQHQKEATNNMKMPKDYEMKSCADLTNWEKSRPQEPSASDEQPALVEAKVSGLALWQKGGPAEAKCGFAKAKTNWAKEKVMQNEDEVIKNFAPDESPNMEPEKTVNVKTDAERVLNLPKAPKAKPPERPRRDAGNPTPPRVEEAQEEI